MLKLLKDNNLTNTLVCVTRWYGGTHLGKLRFKYIEDAAKETHSEIIEAKTEDTRL